MKNRAISHWLREHLGTRRGRLTVLTGARQTGKTTLIRHLCPEYSYISFDDPILRTQLHALSAQDWIARYPAVVLDEIQKMPSMIETVKAIYDSAPDHRLVLLGSSQILLMDQVRESLAGRASLGELMPLTLPELMTDAWGTEVKLSRLLAFLQHRDLSVMQGAPALSPEYSRALKVWERMLDVGAMPYVWQDESIPMDECRAWLKDYVATYLQRDIRDLVVMRDLDPFVRAQQAVAAQSGCLVNASEIARVAGIAPSTAQRFLRYLEMSYQSITLPPWFRNRTKRLMKSGKIHQMDIGILRAILGKRDALTGLEFESAVVGEVYRQIHAARLDVKLYHLRTVDGREIDLLLELDSGYVAIEVKQAGRVSSIDARHFDALQAILDKPILASWVVSNDPLPRVLEDGVMAVPVAWLLSPAG